jgi:hypothetical protein
VSIFQQDKSLLLAVQAHFDNLPNSDPVHSSSMGQARLDRYFTVRDTPRTFRKSYFLGILSNVCYNIYLRAGLVPNQYIDLNYWAPSRDTDDFDLTVDSGVAEEVL